jgi:hypothetical protein
MQVSAAAVVSCVYGWRDVQWRVDGGRAWEWLAAGTHTALCARVMPVCVAACVGRAVQQRTTQ